MVCKCFLPFNRLPLHLNCFSFPAQKLVSWMSHWCAFAVLSEKVIAKINLKDLPCFSSRSPVASGFMCK